MTIQPLTGIIIGIACLSTLGVMIGWYVQTGGAWRRWAAGVTLMGLLAIIAAITALATLSSFFPDFPGRAAAYVVLYALFILSIWAIGWSIFREQRNK